MRTCICLSLAMLASPVVFAENDDLGPVYGSGDVRHVDYFGGLRFDLGEAGGVKKMKTTESQDQQGQAAPGADGETDLSARAGFAANASVFWDWSLDGGFGWAIAPGLYYRQVRGEGSNTRISYRAGGIELATGPSLTVSKLNFELMAFGAIGAAGIKQQAWAENVGGLQRDGGAGSDYRYGVELTADFVSNRNWLLGGNFGYEAFRGVTHMRDTVSASNGLELPQQRAAFSGGGALVQLTFAFWY